jgi:hypothetical protein
MGNYSWTAHDPLYCILVHMDLASFYMIFSILILSFLNLVIISLYSLWMLDHIFGGEDFITSKNAIRKIGEIIAASQNQGGIFYDLGSCRGYFVFGILKICPNLQITGIDNSRLRTWLARLRSNFHAGSPTFKKANIFDTDISKADFIYTYLPRDLVPALTAKLKKDLKPGAMVITYRINFPGWQPHQVFLVDPRNPKEENVYVYKRG